MSRKTIVRTALITVGAVIALVAGLAVWYETTSYRPGDTDPTPRLLTGATVLTGPNLTPTDGVDVLVENGRITALGPDLAATAPSTTEHHDLTGLTLLPGLIDLHVHLGVEQDPAAGPPSHPGLIAHYARYLPDARRDLLAHGVTSVRDLGNETPFIFELRDGVADGSLEGPRIIAAGPVFTTAGGHPVQTVHGGDLDASPSLTPTTPERAREDVRRLAEEGADLIKVIQERGGGDLDPIPVDVLGAIVDEAHAQGLEVTAHWGRLDDLTEVLAAGVDGLVHLESRDLVDGWPPGVLDGLVDAGPPVTASMAVAAAAHPPEVMDLLRRRVAEFHAAGGYVVAGSDAGMPGVGFGSGLHRELAELVGIGMTPTEALQSATGRAAAVLDRPELGAIREGAVADLIAVTGRPHENIDDLSGVRLVLRDGRVVVDEQE